MSDLALDSAALAFIFASILAPTSADTLGFENNSGRAPPPRLSSKMPAQACPERAPPSRISRSAPQGAVRLVPSSPGPRREERTFATPYQAQEGSAKTPTESFASLGKANGECLPRWQFAADTVLSDLGPGAPGLHCHSAPSHQDATQQPGDVGNDTGALPPSSQNAQQERSVAHTKMAQEQKQTTSAALQAPRPELDKPLLLVHLHHQTGTKTKASLVWESRECCLSWCDHAGEALDGRVLGAKILPLRHAHTNQRQLRARRELCVRQCRNW